MVVAFLSTVQKRRIEFQSTFNFLQSFASLILCPTGIYISRFLPAANLLPTSTSTASQQYNRLKLLATHIHIHHNQLSINFYVSIEDLNNVDPTESQFEGSPLIDNNAPAHDLNLSTSFDKDCNMNAKPLDTKLSGDLIKVYQEEGRVDQSTSSCIEDDVPHSSQQTSGKLHFKMTITWANYLTDSPRHSLQQPHHEVALRHYVSRLRASGYRTSDLYRLDLPHFTIS